MVGPREVHRDRVRLGADAWPAVAGRHDVDAVRSIEVWRCYPRRREEQAHRLHIQVGRGLRRVLRHARNRHHRREGWKNGPDISPDAILECDGPRQPHRRVEFALQQAADLRREYRRGGTKWISRMITLTTYKWVPDFAVPLMRAFRVRWALEELGLPYNVRT